MIFSGIAFRNILRNPRRSLLSGFSIALSAASIVFLFAILEGMKIDLSDNIQTFYTGTIRIRHADFEKNKKVNPVHLTVGNSDMIERRIYETVPGAIVAQRIVFPARIYRGESYHNASGYGVDFSSESGFSGKSWSMAEGKIPEEGKREVLLGAGLAKKTGVKPGDSITVFATTAARGSNAMTFTVSGIARFALADFTNNSFMIPLETARYFMKMDSSAGEILIKLEDDSRENGESVIGRLKSYPGGIASGAPAGSQMPEIELSYWQDINDTYSIMSFAEKTYLIFGLFFMLLGSSVIINTAMMIVYERIREIGTLKALGMGADSIARLFFLESFYIGLFSSAVGVAAGVIISLVLNRTGIDFRGAMDNMDIEISGILYPYPAFSSVITIFLCSSFISSVSTLIPALKAAGIKTVDALKHS